MRWWSCWFAKNTGMNQEALSLGTALFSYFVARLNLLVPSEVKVIVTGLWLFPVATSVVKRSVSRFSTKNEAVGMSQSSVLTYAKDLAVQSRMEGRTKDTDTFLVLHVHYTTVAVRYSTLANVCLMSITTLDNSSI